MNRLLSTIKMDVTIQVRNQLYSIGIGAGLLVAFMLGRFGSDQYMPQLVPTLMLAVAGGSTCCMYLRCLSLSATKVHSMR